MEIKQYTIGPIETNCYVLSDGGDAVIIDAAVYHLPMVEYIETNRLKVKAIVLTHGHFDHVSGAAQLSDKFNAPIAIGKKDEEMYYNTDINGALMFGDMTYRSKEAEILLSDGDKIQFGSVDLTVIETPGHSLGGISLYTKGHLFCGDTLFELYVGRTDFYGGDANTLINSISQKLYKLADDTVVYPGHGPATTIGYEKKENYYVKG